MLTQVQQKEEIWPPNIMNFRPIGKWMSVLFRPPKIKSDGGLYLAVPEYSQVATVSAIGEGVENVKIGDTVMMHKHGDAMDTQKSLWYHYFTAIKEGKSVDDFIPPPVVITDDDVFGLWDDEKGFIPHKNNIVVSEHLEPERVNGVIRVVRHRQNRRPICDIMKVSPNVKHLKIGQTILLGKYGGVYFKDIDGDEKVLVAATEVLGTFTSKKKIKSIAVSEPKEIYDPKAGSELLN